MLHHANLHLQLRRDQKRAFHQGTMQWKMAVRFVPMFLEFSVITVHFASFATTYGTFFSSVTSGHLFYFYFILFFIFGCMQVTRAFVDSHDKLPEVKASPILLLHPYLGYLFGISFYLHFHFQFILPK